MVPSASLSQVSGASAALFNNLKQSSSGAADRLGKAGKGFFGKITRSGSTNEREFLSDDNYICTVINLPLIQQARRTRIAKRLEDCRDKTEFWMPALPYRCIEYGISPPFAVFVSAQVTNGTTATSISRAAKKKAFTVSLVAGKR